MKFQTDRSNIHGRGIFATERILCVEVVLKIDDSRIVDDEHPIQENLGENVHLANGREIMSSIGGFEQSRAKT